MDSATVPRKLWEHSDPQSTEMHRFMQELNKEYHLEIKTFWELYEYSIAHRSHFWAHALRFLAPIYSGSYVRVVDESARIDTVPRWFEGVRINFAENILYSDAGASGKCTRGKEETKIALTEIREGLREVRHVSWGCLRTDVAVLASAMRENGVAKGDRIMAVASNSVDTLKVFLATTTLGGLFSSSSTDMGVQGVLQRTLQVKPKFIFMDDFAVYNGKKVDLREKMMQIVDGMKSVDEFRGMILLPRFSKAADLFNLPKTQTLASYISTSREKPGFERVAFHDPFLIAYSSGTTGTPKCIVQSVGGAILSALKEAKLHREMNAKSVALQYTTTGWIMYLASVANLLVGARVILYDGSPFQPDLRTFLRMVGDERVTHFGTSPRWMHEMQKNGIVPKETADLSSLRVVTSTGMVLSDQLFEWFYDVAFPPHVHLANISGGTEIAGCFGQENPLTPLYVGGTQGPSLGTPVAVYDSLIEGGKGIRGVPVKPGTSGELVAPVAFPNMPVFFWNDDDRSRYFSAYFEKYDNVWTHGDFVMLHPVTKNILFLGRADGILNPSGVRFGSAEIYAVVDSFPAVADSLCVAQQRPHDKDEHVLLFLLMQPGEKFTAHLVKEVETAIRTALSARHVPKYIFETPEIPTTVNLKKVELPVKQIVSGKTITPSGTLLNPQSLEYYYQFAKPEKLDHVKSRI